MEREIQSMCQQMTKDRLQRLLEGLQGLHYEKTHFKAADENQNKEKMASFAQVTENSNRKSDNNDTVHDDPQNSSQNTGSSNTYKSEEKLDPSDFVKPIFLKDEDVHGSVKPPRSQWLTNIEIYKAIDQKIPAERIKGIQRVRDMWRIYMDNEEDKLSLLISGINLRGRQVPLYSQNPRNPGYQQPDTIRITVRNVPISADDGQIHRALTLQGCEIQSIFRQRLRVNGKLTNCQTGDRVVISKLLEHPIPRNLSIGKYMALIFHAGQTEFQNRRNFSEDNAEGNVKTCHKCLQEGHLIAQCPNDWVCKTCKLPGHKMMDCSNAFQDDNSVAEQELVHVANIADSQAANNVPNTQLHSNEEVTAQPQLETKDGSSSVDIQNTDKQGGPKVGSSKASGGKKSNSGSHGNNDKSQASIDKFVKTPANNGQRRPALMRHTPPTPPERDGDKTKGVNGSKKAKP